MSDQRQGDFLRKRMIELREKNHKSQSDMATILYVNKSTLSRVESGNTSYKNIKEFATKYCDVFGFTDEQKKIFLRGTKGVVVDTSALLIKTQLIEELSKEYEKVIIPSVVIDELDNIKDNNTNDLAKKAWQILKNISNHNNIFIRKYISGEKVNNDSKILDIAQKASEEFNCSIDIITYDVGFAARLRGTDSVVNVLYLEEYIATKQDLHDIDTLNKIDNYYADSYDDIEKQLGIKIPSSEDLNAYLANGNTLIISAIRRKNIPVDKRINKIKWLIEHGADINKRDAGKDSFPPLSHVIQNNDRFPNNDMKLFKFILNDCQANPNVGSRHPHDVGKIRQANGGNMPLMVAAWHNKPEYVKILCDDERTSLNQQDGNGYTALTKAYGNGFLECKDILVNAGADQKIVDRDGKTAEKRYEEYLDTGIRMNRKYVERIDGVNKKRSGGYGNRR